MDPIPVLDHDAVLAAVGPGAAIEAVREGFIRHYEGDWQMPPKVYVQSPPNGDFRAMPASGGGLAIVKWVTSFPGNPARGLPVVMGTILVSDADDGRLLAIVDGRAVTALRTGAAAAVATQALARNSSSTVGLIGCGLHGMWAARCLREIGYRGGTCFDLNEDAAKAVAQDVGWWPGTREQALGCDVIVTVTPGDRPVVTANDLRPGMHINALGADGSGKAELEIEAVRKCLLFCDEWEQASHGGELAGGAERGIVMREHVTEIGEVLLDENKGRQTDEEVTLFDSTGLAIQDLAIVLTLMKTEAARQEGIPTVRL